MEIIMKRLLLMIPFATACIIVDGDGDKDFDWDSGWEDTNDDSDATDDTETEENDEEPMEDHNGSFFLVPSAAAPGDTFISSLRSVDSINWSTVQSVTAFGNIEICGTQPLFDEMLLTITIPSDAQEAPIDILIEYTDGDVDLIEDALHIDQEADIGTAVVSSTECE
jgi:hypothetical protein